ncbi:hypothetical protein T08_14679 [Trichinella sp. T8]|nr:hypothetical protein T08_14679 [Trichinella sp. T8]
MYNVLKFALAVHRISSFKVLEFNGCYAEGQRMSVITNPLFYYYVILLRLLVKSTLTRIYLLPQDNGKQAFIQDYTD